MLCDEARGRELAILGQADCVVFWVPASAGETHRVGSLHACAASLALSAADCTRRIAARQARVFETGMQDADRAALQGTYSKC